MKIYKPIFTEVDSNSKKLQEYFPYQYPLLLKLLSMAKKKWKDSKNGEIADYLHAKIKNFPGKYTFDDLMSLIFEFDPHISKAERYDILISLGF